jgi:hypothetical protein
MPVARLKARPSGLEKSWSPVRLERLTLEPSASAWAPKAYTSQVKLVAADRGAFLHAHDVAVGIALLRAGALHVGVGTRVGGVGGQLAAAARSTLRLLLLVSV